MAGALMRGRGVRLDFRMPSQARGIALSIKRDLEPQMAIVFALVQPEMGRTVAAPDHEAENPLTGSLAARIRGAEVLYPGG